MAIEKRFSRGDFLKVVGAGAVAVSAASRQRRVDARARGEAH